MIISQIRQSWNWWQQSAFGEMLLTFGRTRWNIILSESKSKTKKKETLEYHFQIDESMSKMAENRSIYIFFLNEYLNFFIENLFK